MFRMRRLQILSIQNAVLLRNSPEFAPFKTSPLVENTMSDSISSAVINNREIKSQGINFAYSRQILQTVIPLLLIDAACLICCFAIAYFAGSLFDIYNAAPSSCMWLLLVLFGGMASSFLILELYDPVGMHPVYEFRQMTLCNGVLYIMTTWAMFYHQNPHWVITALMFPMLLVLTPICRAVGRSLLAKTKWWGVRCLVFSAERRVDELYYNHMKNKYLGLRPVGFVQDELPDDCADDIRPYHLGRVPEAKKISEANDAHVALVHRFGRAENELSSFIRSNLKSYVRVVTQPDDSRLPSIQAIGRNGGISFEDRLMLPSSKITKRLVDLAISCSVLFFGLPFFAAIAVWLKIADPGPLFFGHERICRNGKRFKAWKFRTMAVNSDEILKKHLEENPEAKAEWDATYKLQNDPRVSLPGRILRKTSLDELPQIWNILVGEMSLVGPRPIVVGEVERYEAILENYIRVQPGLTGLWQVSGRNLTTYKRRVELDDYYVRNWSVWFDFYIIGRTFKTVLMREGAF